MSTLTRFAEARLGRELDDPDPVVVRRARNRLVEANLAVCDFEAARFKGCGIDREDLMQEGAFGLLKTCNHWEPARGRFSTLAKFYVRARMLACIRERRHAVRVPHLLDGRRRRIDRALELQPHLSVEQLADQLAVPVSQVRDALSAGRVVASLDKVIDEDDGQGTIGSRIPAPEVDLDQQIDLKNALAKLPERERAVVTGHYLEELTIPAVQRATHHDYYEVKRAEARGLEASPMRVVTSCSLSPHPHVEESTPRFRRSRHTPSAALLSRPV
ncbi:MAG TPA: sigma-70 family RNA polymerase sigma factor [Solirubrobacteraceae bacterium]